MALPGYAMNQASFPELYEQFLVGPLFRPWAEITLDELKLHSGDRVLDIACGTGIVARLAKERLGDGGKVVGVDISPEMLAVARSKAPDIDWRAGNASALPCRAEEQFNFVICQQGLQFFPDKPSAVAQMRRALAKDGRLAVSTWRSDDEIPFFRKLRRIAERRLGEIVDRRYSLGDAAVLEGLLRDAGFEDVRSGTISRIIRFESDTWFPTGNAMALVGMSAAGKGMSEKQRSEMVDTIVSESASLLQSYADGAGFAFELTTNLATARG